MSTSSIVDFKTEQPPRLIIERFPDHEQVIEALWNASEEFREVCTDFASARVSLNRAKQSHQHPRTVARYEELLEELQLELLALFDAAPRGAS